MFKKCTALFLSAFMVVSMAACGSSTKQPTETNTMFKAGTYEAEADGMNGKVKVAVTVDDQKITKVEVVSHSETAGLSDPAIQQIPQKITEQQTVAIDAISGCTISSKAILEAVKTALLAAGATEADITKAPVVTDQPKEAVSKTADVVIVGAGGAGMSAAVEVIKAGGSVILIDKLSSAGGNTILAGSAMNAANPQEQKKQEMTSSQVKAIEELLALPAKHDLMAKWQADVKADLDKYKAEGATYLYDSASLHKLQTYADGDYVGNPELIDIYGDHALESVKWLQELGTQWKPTITAAVGATWNRSHTPEATFGSAGAAFVVPQQKFVEANGGEILTGYKAEELVMKDGRVVGVKGNTLDGAAFELTANKGVLLATGGFSANVEMRQKYNKQWATLDASIPTSNGPQATGDGIVMAEAVGANLVGMEWIQMLPTTVKSFSPAIDSTILVNKEGKRFIREDGRRDEISKATLEQPETKYWRILDTHLTQDLLKGISYTGEVIDETVDGKGIFKADTLEELATMLGIPGDALVQTVNEFNGYVENNGAGDPTGRTLFKEKLDKGPYYALVGLTKVHHTMGGIEINGEAQVLDTKGAVIPGLFAAGEVTGGIHGANRLGGNAITDVVTFGRIAGQSMMK
ncbi:MAG: flavocytochrome c [Angelakisella sp.]